MIDLFYITDGTERIDMVLTATDYGINPMKEGVPLMAFDPASYYSHLKSVDDLLFVERWSFAIRDLDTDGTISLTRKLLRMLLRAWLFTEMPRYREDGPIYFVQQVKGETNERYSLVHSSPDLSIFSGLMHHPLEVAKLIDEVGISIARFAWEDGAPGTVPSTKQAFSYLYGGDTVPTLVPIANHFDDHAVNLVYRFDATGPTYTDVTASAAHNIFPAAPAAGDIYYIGGPSPFWHFWWYLGTLAAATGLDLVWEYSDGVGGWPALTYGDDLMLYPEGDENDFFSNALGVNVASFHPGDDWDSEAVNGQTRFWIRIRINAMTTFVTPPANATYAVYNPRRPYVEIPSTLVGGDVPPALQFRYLGFDGGDENVELTDISRIIVGGKTRHIDDGEFESHLNPGGDGLPAGWAVSYGDDTATQTDSEAPGGDSALCDFTAETSVVMRVRFTGTAKAPYYPGKYRPFLKFQQIGGDAGDIDLHLRIRIDSTAEYGAQADTTPISTTAADAGFELADMTPGSYIQVPFGVFHSADSLVGANMIFEIWAGRDSGSVAEIEFYELALVPVDEWSVEYQDPISNSDTGSSALRGLEVIIDDGGIVSDRCGLFKIDGSEEWYIEWWERHGKAPTVIPLFDRPMRLYFIFGYFNSTWGGAPLLSVPGMSIMMEWLLRTRYLWLRGDD